MTQAEFDQLKPGDVVVLAPPDMIDETTERHRIVHTNIGDELGTLRSVVWYTEVPRDEAEILTRAEEPPKV